MLEPIAADPAQLDQVIAALRSLSLVQRHPETQTFSLHRLVQTVLRELMSGQERAICFPLSERLCLACPQVSVSVRFKRVGRADRVLLSAKGCCHVPVLLSGLLSVEKQSKPLIEQSQNQSEARGDPAF